MPHTFSDVLIHVIFSTKERVAAISDELRRELYAYMGGVVRRLGGKALLINGTRDHVHMLIRVPTDLCPAECLRIVKANSSRWVYEKWPERSTFAWQTGYAAFSVSVSQRNRVYRYIRDQEQHHKKFSFAEEIAAFLRTHGGNPADFVD